MPTKYKGTCLQCGNKYEGYGRNFCSNECRGKYISLHGNKVIQSEFNEAISERDKIGYVKKNLITPEDSLDFIKRSLYHGAYIDYLTKKLDWFPTEVHDAIDKLKEEGYLIEWDEDRSWAKLRNSTLGGVEFHDDVWDNSCDIIKFGVVADTHMSSLKQQLTHLNALYDIFESEGVCNVYHVGDIDDGCNMRKGQEYEKFNQGLDAQAGYIINNYPRRKGIKTRFITGNHDLSYVKSAGCDIGIRLALCRPDMEYLGQLNTTVYITPNCRIELNHALDGSAFAESYAAQRYADSIMGGDKPNILLQGHHHKAIYFPYRNIHIIEAGCMQDRTSFERGKRIRVTVGGWIVECHVKGDGTVWRVKPEFIQFHKMIEEDY